MDLVAKKPLSEYTVQDFLNTSWIEEFYKKYPDLKGESDSHPFLVWMVEALIQIEADNVDPTPEQIQEMIEDVNGLAFDFDEEAMEQAISMGAIKANDDFIRMACLNELGAGDLIRQLRNRLGLKFVELESCIVFLGPQPMGQMAQGMQIIAAEFNEARLGSDELKDQLGRLLNRNINNVMGGKDELDRLSQTLEGFINV